MIKITYAAATLADFTAALDILASHPAARLCASVQAPSATPRQAPATKGNAYEGELIDGLTPSEYYRRERKEIRYRRTTAENEAGMTSDESALKRMENPDWRKVKVGAATAADDSPPVIAASELDESDL